MFLSAALGALVGIIMGLTGAGGGILAVPLLVFGLGLSVAQAGPIGLLAVGAAATLGAGVGLLNNIVRYRAAVLMAATGILIAPLGVSLAHRVDTRMLSVLFAVVLLWVAYKSFTDITAERLSTDALGEPPCKRFTATGRFTWTNWCAAMLTVTGGLAGLLSGMLGVGGGFVMVPALQRFTDLETRSLVATSLTVIALVSLAGVFSSWLAGHLDVVLALPFAAGALAGMAAASLISSQFPAKYLKIAFAVICLVVAVGMLAKAT